MELKASYQRTEAGVLPLAWQAAMLGDHVKITSGISPSLLTFKADGMPYFKVEQLSNSDKYLDANSTPYHFQTGPTVQAGSVIFAKRGAAIALNKIRILSEESFMDTNLMSLTPSAALDVDYLFYGLGFIGLWRFADTTSVPQINNKHIKPLAFPLPEIEEQKAIASALADVDALIAGLEKLIAKKRDLKQAAMQQLLTGQTRLPGFSGEWEVKRLGDVGVCLRGVSYKGDADLFPHDTDTSKRLLRSNNVQESLVVTSDLQYVKADRVREHQILRDGDVLICMANGSKALVGKAGYFDVSDEFEYTFGAFMGAYRGNEQANRRFVFYLFQTNRYRDYIANILAGSSINNLSPSSIESLEFNFPELSEQGAIAQTLNDMDSELISLETRLAKTRELKQGMMQELLTGRTRLV